MLRKSSSTSKMVLTLGKWKICHWCLYNRVWHYGIRWWDSCMQNWQFLKLCGELLSFL